MNTDIGVNIEYNKETMDFLFKTFGINKQLRVGVLHNPKAPKRSGSIAGIGGYKFRRDSRVTLEAVAYWHEMGLVPGAPQRAFIRPTFYKHKKAIYQGILGTLKRAFRHRNLALVKNDLNGMGVFLLQSMRKHILTGEGWKPLSPNTRPGALIRMPMLDSWQLIGSLGYEVIEKDTMQLNDSRGASTGPYLKGE